MSTLSLEYPHQCPYLANRTCTNLVFEMANLDSATTGALINEGWRHFASSWFRPICPECRLCDGIAIPADSFAPSKSQRRLLKKNADLTVEMHPLSVDEEHIALVNLFQKDRSERLGWNPVIHTEESYRCAFVDGTTTGRELRIIDKTGKIIGVDIIDLTTDAINSIYCYIDPSWEKRSLGIWSVLMEIGLAKKLSIPYVHLGLVNAECASLAYKSSFGPFIRIKQPELGDAVEGVRKVFAGE